jgi:hypothetical protein
MPWLGALLASLLGTAISRMLVGAGLALVTFAAITPLVLSALNAGAQAFNNIGGAVLQMMLISGLGVALSAIGSAMLTRMAIDAAKTSLSVKKKA